jgi:hypothetical protein
MADVQNTVPAAATTPQQQPQGTPIQQNAPTPASVAGGSGGDQLVCQWQSCGERLPSAEQLYVSNLSRASEGVACAFNRQLLFSDHTIPLFFNTNLTGSRL